VDRILFTADKIAEILKCDWVGNSRGIIDNIQIDSRECGRGTLFIPLKGERTDGHLYLDGIASQGSQFSLVDINWYSENRNPIEKLIRERGMTFLPVANTLSALQELAVYHMSLYPELLVVGITGSNGKTTTKEILGSILSESFETIVNVGNLNSDIGLPLSVFRVEEKHRVAVFEMGMNRIGEMELLASIVKPDFAVITNIGTAHIGLLGSQKAIAVAKKKIFSCFTGKETAIIPEDDEFCDFLQNDVKGKIVRYGTNSVPEVKLKSEFTIEGFDLEIGGFACHFPLPGEHNFYNVLAAVATALEIGVTAESIARGIGKIQSLFGRGELIKGNITLLRDCYNANPDSMEESLKTLSYWRNRSIAVLGDMLELGEDSFKQHSRIGELASKSAASAIFLFGNAMEAAFESVKVSGYSGYSFWTSDFESFKEALVEYIQIGDLVLLKGSRGLALERLTDFVMNKK
jgi:UDP-N-acetylmuramoyl-tripeptide--D-alanyl-D-alanine ligase